MKTTVCSLILAALTCGVALSQEAPVSESLVSKALQAPSISYLTETKPAADARFYIYLSSASWCPPCRALMPRVVVQYPEIKAAGGEVILLCFDRTQEAGKNYLKKYGASFPTIMVDYRNPAALIQGLPGFTPPRGIPHTIIVGADGNVLHAGHGASILNWREITNRQ